MDKANITTYLNGVLLAIFTYAGISQSTSNLIIQLLAPVISILLAYIMSYVNEKYPSSLVTSVNTCKCKEDDDAI